MRTRVASRSKKSRSDAEGVVHATAQISAAIDESLRQQVQDVCKGLTESFIMHFKSRIRRGVAPCSDEWESQLEAIVPDLMAEAFIEEFLGASDVSRRRRARLSHLLSTVELMSLNEPVVATSPFRDRAPKIADAKVEAGELTSEAAAKLLHVSRTHLNLLVEDGKLGEVRRTRGGHRRIRLSAVLDYKEKTKIVQETGLTRMIEASQCMGLYDDELKELPVRQRR